MAKRGLTFRRWFYLFLPIIFTSFLISVNPVSAGSLTYTYDNLNRLIMAECSDGSVIEFTYDAAGNRITKEVTPGNTCEGDVNEIPGDLDGDCDVDGDDRSILWALFRKCEGDSGYNADADYDGDGCITFGDYRIWYGHYKAANLL